MLLASSHHDVIIGLDVHIVMVPSPGGPIPTPLPHPFVGFVLDLTDYIPKLGATVAVNNKMRGCSFTTGMLGTARHFPMPPGASFSPKPIGHDAYKFFGSLRVKAEGHLLGVSPFTVMSCSDVGVPMSITPGKNFKPVPTTYLPTSACIPITTGKPVMVGGPYGPDVKGLMMSIAMSFGLGSLMKGGGKLLNRLLRKMNTKRTNRMADWMCKRGFEPVDLITGIVFYEATDFSIAGPLPLKWERYYYSDSLHKGPLGLGVHSNFDLALELHPEEPCIIVILPDGRSAIFDWLGEAGDRDDNLGEKMTLTRTPSGFVLKDHSQHLNYEFEAHLGGAYRPRRVVNPQGFAIQYNYNAQGKWVGLTDSVGRLIHFDFSEQGMIAKVYATYKGQRREMISYGYSENGELTRITDALGQSAEIHYENHLMVKQKDKNGDVFYWEYEGTGREAKCVHTWGENGLMEGWIDYREGCNEVRNSCGETFYYFFDENNLCNKIEDPEGNSKEYLYTDDFQLYREVDEEGLVTGFTYDESGNMDSLQKPDGTVQRFIFNEARHLEALVSEAGNATIYSYDEAGLIKNISYPDGKLVELVYNENRQLSLIKSKGETLYSLEYDGEYNLIKMTLPGGAIQTWRYDLWGRCVEAINSEHHRQEFEYDNLDRQVGIKEADGNRIHMKYDAYEDVIQVKDKQRQVKLSYNALGSVTRREEAGRAVTFHYDAQNRLTGLRNEHDEVYRFILDPVGRVKEEIGFDGLKRTYLRDRAGKVIRINRPGGRWTDHEYDLDGRVIRSEYSDGSWETYGYDREGRLIEAVNENSHVALHRDKAGRVVKEVQDGHMVESAYDDKGFRTTIKSNIGAEILLDWDEAGEVRQMKARHAESQGAWEALLTHNRLGQERTRRVGVLENEFSYDKAGRVASQRTSSGGHTHLHKHYHWGINDKLHRIHDLLGHGCQDFEYDAVGNLIQSLTSAGERENYFRDEIGNIFQETDRSDRKYDKGGKLVSKGKNRYHYDEEGNLIQKCTSKGDWVYQWNGNGSLKEVLRPDGERVAFEYDALGRRTAKAFQGKLTRWVWDGNMPLHEWHYRLEERPGLVLNADGLLTQDREEPIHGLITWVFDENSFKPAAKLMGDKAFSILNDYLGTPKQACDQHGEKVWDCKHKAYGEVVSYLGDIDFIPFRFQGQYQDIETGLYYNRFRYYDPSIGNFFSQDPIGLLGNNPNFYAYVKDTNIWIDIFGLDPYGVNQDVYAFYNKADVVNGIPIEGAKPYYIGISKNSDIRLVQHSRNGRFDPATDVKVDLQKDIEYAKARAYEQYYIEKFETIDKTNPKANQQNSFRHSRTDARGQAFETEYKNIKCK
jgi:RHS repeat-associated protein